MGVIKLALSKGLDLLTIPSHTSHVHALEPLDVTCFKPFKLSFRAYQNKWTNNHQGKMPIKEDLAQWGSNSFRRALSTKNITKGFEVIGIFLFNANAMKGKMGPHHVYKRSGEGRASSSNGPSLDLFYEKQ